MSDDPDPTLQDLHRFAVVLAAGAALRVSTAGAVAGVGAEVGSKSTPTDLVTATDRATERWLVARIAEQRPGDAILGEEGGPRPGTSGVRWLLDPIDGTVNFVLGLPQYAVSVAAELDGVVVAGAVANPVSGELFHAFQGGGAWLRTSAGGTTRDLALHGPRSVPLPRAVVATGFGYDPARRARQVAVVAPMLPRVADLRRLGSAALDLCFVAAGRLDAYFEAGLNPWDHAAGGLVAREAGCVVVGARGEPERLLVAAGADLADDLMALLTDLGADTVTDG
ncbi:inositol monophosphatase family protein [Jatrophihabitans endophyticus]|uniref:inositol monophosphatase family protein n=1 Tax=Jatrophihabitans endophyticus TaxID=1206085 RepID=UPI0019ED6A9C|nr:inositol monophosphatase family protein [Jatrophihabitans endophyticus]MBE7186857.1 inositol monophosphatase [Jatrophihabitans endophyticus]